MTFWTFWKSLMYDSPNDVVFAHLWMLTRAFIIIIGLHCEEALICLLGLGMIQILLLLDYAKLLCPHTSEIMCSSSS